MHEQEEDGLTAGSATPLRAHLPEGSRAFLTHFAILFAFWLVLSGLFDWFHLAAGFLSAAAVAALTYRLQILEPEPPGPRMHLARAPWPRLFLYLLWLLREVAKANIQVLRVVLHPRLPIDPVLVRFRAHLTSDLAKTILANSITLTPGTITVEVRGDEFLVHSLLGPEVTRDIARMQNQIARALPRIEGAVEPLVDAGS